MITVKSLGGSGEDSRNCFLIESDDLTVLFDCGVRREIASVERVYPLLTEQIARKLDAVIISHAHEDHTVALPYLYHLGYRKPVYASRETIERIPGFLNKWADYVEKNNGTLPFERKDIDKLTYRTVDELDLDLTWGRSGHMIGSLWYLLTLEGRKILYTGDITFDAMLLETDSLPECDVLITDSAYRDQKLNQKKQYEKLREAARHTSGRLLLPVPANGRGIDIFEYLKPLGLNLFVEKNIEKNAARLFTRDYWLNGTEQTSGTYTVVTDGIRCSDMPGTYLFADGMMTSEVSLAYFETVRNDPESSIIITGHSAKGTLANDLLNHRIENTDLTIQQLTIKVHLDKYDVLKAAGTTGARQIMLFHAAAEKCTSLIDSLKAAGVEVICGIDKPLTVI
ncbi:MAG: MBL fold metallo-hydrolase [Erysipelotrichaceae bacterium]|nr:MBL fold metallo-hydrolase [Erysipelotrichaceae bacterium]